jgi:hypothetical protein
MQFILYGIQFLYGISGYVCFCGSNEGFGSIFIQQILDTNYKKRTSLPGHNEPLLGKKTLDHLGILQ